MELYKLIIEILWGVGIYLGLEHLGRYFISRDRQHLLIAAMGISSGFIIFLQSGIYQQFAAANNQGPLFAQLIIYSLHFCVMLAIGLELSGQLHPMYVMPMALIILFSASSLIFPQWWIHSPSSAVYLSLSSSNYFVPHWQPLTIIFHLLMAIVLVVVGLRLWRHRREHKGYTWQWSAVFFAWALLLGAESIVPKDNLVAAYILKGGSSFSLVAMLASLHLALAREQELKRYQLLDKIKSHHEHLDQVHADLSMASKMAVVGRLASGVAHEVNNPLTYVLAKLEMLYQILNGQPKARRLAHEALHGAKRIKRVMRQISHFAPAQEQGRQLASVSSAVEVASKLAMLEIRDRAMLTIDLPDLPPVKIDEVELSQVLVNLLVNAAHAIKPGDRENNSITVAAYHHASLATVEIVVEDTGTGIEPSSLEKIFDPFFTTKNHGDGMGLGLSICSTLLRKAGGNIYAQNRASGGARFIIEVPEALDATFADLPEHNDIEISTVDALRLSEKIETRRSLLLVDDDPDVLQVLQEMLQVAFEVTMAHSGREALKLIEAGREFDHIVCDMMMPDGAGVDVLQRLQQTHPHLAKRLIFMSGGAPEKERAALAALTNFSPVSVINKPFNLRELHELIFSKNSSRQAADKQSLN